MATTAPTVSNESHAAEILEQALREHLTLEPDQVLELKGWPSITLTLTGPSYEGTITAATAKALIEIQHAVDQTYISLVRPGAKRLTDAEKRRTTITARVNKGSSIVNVEMGDAFTRLASDLASKMSPDQIIITVLGVSLIAGSTLVAKEYVRARAAKAGKEAELATEVALSEQETKRLKIVAEATSRQPKLVDAREEFDAARDEVLRSAAGAETVNLDGVKMTGEQARALPREPRTSSVEVQLNGTYLIGAVSWPAGDEEAVLDLRSTAVTREFKATLLTRSLMQKDKDLLASAEWSRTPVYLQINARMLRGEVTKATIVGFDWDKLRQLSSTPTDK